MQNASLTLLLLLASAAVRAEAEWAGETAAGYLVTAGNAETTSLNFRQTLDYKADEQWTNNFTAAATNTGGDEGTTAERYLVSDKLNYSYSERNYVFGVAEYEKDRFGGIRERTSQALGYGRRILTGPVHLWEAEIGAGARQTEANVTGERESDAIGRLSSKYEWVLSETARVIDAVKIESGETNTLSENVAELKLAVIGDLSAVISYSLRHNTDVPAGTEKLDTTAGVTLNYGFGKKK